MSAPMVIKVMTPNGKLISMKRERIHKKNEGNGKDHFLGIIIKFHIFKKLEEISRNQ